MKAIRWYAPRTMRMVDLHKPEPKPDEALLRIESVGLCGSDIHYYLDGFIGNQVVKRPLILGHEYAGIVDAVGPDADQSLIGKRVAVEPGIPCGQCEWCARGDYNVCEHMFFPGGPGCDGALSEYYTVHAGFCHPVPENLSAASAAMAEPLAVAVHAAELADLQPGDTAAVFGLGPIGLLTAQVLRAKGIETIYGADPLAYRVRFAERFHINALDNSNTDTTRWLHNRTGNRGVDVSFDCTNSSDGIELACRAARPAGRVVLVGISGKEHDLIPVSTARRRELELRWCRRFKNNYPEALALLESGEVDVQSLITHSFPLERTPEAFEIVAHYRDNVLKASIDQ